MTIPFIVGNWKMNTSLQGALSLARTVSEAAVQVGPGVTVGVCPPYPWIVPVVEAIRDSPVRIGAQDCSAHDNGAYTGDVSATMLAAFCAFTLVGHSERRSVHQETNDIVRQKLRQALHAGLDVILCVGESTDERDSGIADDVVRGQLVGALTGLHQTEVRRVTIAYEPVWAIGTGLAATASDASRMAKLIQDEIDSRLESGSSPIRVLYGGSANDRNVTEFLAADHVDGLLVGSASLSANVFATMIKCAVGKP